MECRQDNGKPNWHNQMSAAPKQCHYFTLWIKRLSCIKTHHVITDNCRPEQQLFDSTSKRRLQRLQYCKNTMSALKAELQMTTTRPDTSWKTTTPLTHSCRNEGVIQLSPLGSDSDAMFEVVEISDACFVHLLLQYAPRAVVNRILIWRIWRPQ